MIFIAWFFQSVTLWLMNLVSAGLQEDPGKFFLFLLVLFLVTMCASAIAFSVSASVSVFAIANLICVLIFIIMMVRSAQMCRSSSHFSSSSSSWTPGRSVDPIQRLSSHTTPNCPRHWSTCDWLHRCNANYSARLDGSVIVNLLCCSLTSLTYY